MQVCVALERHLRVHFATAGVVLVEVIPVTSIPHPDALTIGSALKVIFVMLILTGTSLHHHGTVFLARRAVPTIGRDSDLGLERISAKIGRGRATTAAPQSRP
jgi:hypothetical protein